MTAKKMLVVLAAALMTFPAMAGPIKGKLISINDKEVIIKNKKLGKKKFKLDEYAQILDKHDVDIAIADFQPKMVEITLSEEDEGTAIEVKEVLVKAKKKKKSDEE